MVGQRDGMYNSFGYTYGIFSLYVRSRGKFAACANRVERTAAAARQVTVIDFSTAMHRTKRSDGSHTRHRHDGIRREKGEG